MSPAIRRGTPINARGTAPIVAATGWLLLRLLDHGGAVDSRVIYAEADAASIPASRLNSARRYSPDVVSLPAVGRAQNRRIWRLSEPFETEEADAV